MSMVYAFFHWLNGVSHNSDCAAYSNNRLMWLTGASNTAYTACAGDCKRVYCMHGPAIEKVAAGESAVVAAGESAVVPASAPVAETTVAPALVAALAVVVLAIEFDYYHRCCSHIHLCFCWSAYSLRLMHFWLALDYRTVWFW